MSQPYFEKLAKRVNEEYSQKTVFPPYENILRALELTPKDKVKASMVTSLGQDQTKNDSKRKSML